jgi:hypothetical protein
MNGLLNQTVQQELSRQYRAQMEEKASNARLLKNKSPSKRPEEKRIRKEFAPSLKPWIAAGTAIAILTILLIAQNVAAAGGGGGGAGFYLVM